MPHVGRGFENGDQVRASFRNFARRESAECSEFGDRHVTKCLSASAGDLPTSLRNALSWGSDAAASPTRP